MFLYTQFPQYHIQSLSTGETHTYSNYWGFRRFSMSIKWEHMKKSHVNAKNKLLKEKAEIELRLGSLRHGDRDKDGQDDSEKSGWVEYGQKNDENAAEVTEYANQLSIVTSLEERLVSLTSALDAIEKNEYGKCEECGNEIEDARLEAMPTATLCMSCKKKK